LGFKVSVLDLPFTGSGELNFFTIHSSRHLDYGF